MPEREPTFKGVGKWKSEKEREYYRRLGPLLPRVKQIRTREEFDRLPDRGDPSANTESEAE